MHISEYTRLQDLLGVYYAKQSWRTDMAADKKRGGNLGWALQPKVAKILNQVKKKERQYRTHTCMLEYLYTDPYTSIFINHTR